MIDALLSIAEDFPEHLEVEYPHLKSKDANDKNPIVEVVLSDKGIIQEVHPRRTGRFWFLQPNNHNRLFFNNKIDDLDKISNEEQKNTLISSHDNCLGKLNFAQDSPISRTVAAIKAALENPTEFKEFIVKRCKEIGLNKPKEASVVFRTEIVDTQDPEILQLLNDRWGQFAKNKNSSKKKNAETIDILGNTGEIHFGPMAQVQFPGFKSGLSPYCRKRTKRIDHVYGLKEMEAIPLTIDAVEKARLAFKACADQQRLYGLVAKRLQLPHEYPYLAFMLPRDNEGQIIKNQENDLITSLIDTTNDEFFDQYKTETAEQDEDTQEQETAQEIYDKLRRIFSNHIKIIEGLNANNPEGNLDLHIFQKRPDDSPTMIMKIEESISYSSLHSAMTRWQTAVASPCEAFQHLPKSNYGWELSVRDVHRIMNLAFSKNACRSGDNIDQNQVKYIKNRKNVMVNFRDVLHLLLHQDANVANKILSVIARHHFHLILDVQSRWIQNKYGGDKKPLTFGVRGNFFRIPSIFAICMYAKGETMERVKESPGFNLGKACNIATKMHCEYHRINGSPIPRNGLKGQEVMTLVSNGASWSKCIATLKHKMLPIEKKAEYARFNYKNMDDKEKERHEHIITLYNVYKNCFKQFEKDSTTVSKNRITDQYQAEAAIGYQCG